MLKINEAKLSIMTGTNPEIISRYLFTKKVLSDEGIKYFLTIFNELRELCSMTAPFTSKEFKSIISRVYDIGNELKTNKYLHINGLEKFDKYYSKYIQPFVMMLFIIDNTENEDTIKASSVGNTNTISRFGHAEELDKHKEMLILQIIGAVIETINGILDKKAS